MITTDKFLQLHGKEVERNELENLVQEAKQERNTEVVYRLSKILRDNPNDAYFYMSIKKYNNNSTLAAPRHKGNYKEALTECGRLKKGWKFENGIVAKIPVAKFKKDSVISYKERKGTISKVIRTPKKSSFFGKESYLYNLTFDNKRKAINIPESKIKKYIQPKKVVKSKQEVTKVKKTEKSNNLGFSKDDISYDLAYRAHTGTSFYPEKRAKAHQNEYYSYLKEVYVRNYTKAQKLDKVGEFKAKFNRFKNGYLKRYIAYLSSKNGMMSTMITGASNFPVRRMQKKLETINKRLSELVEFGEKYDNFFKPKSPEKIKTGSTNSLDKLNKKLSSLEEQHSLMKKGNAVINKVLRKKGLSKEEQIKQITLGFEDFYKQKVIETWVEIARRENGSLKNTSFYLTNLTANIRNVKKQIELEKTLSKQAKEFGNTEYEFEGGVLVLNRELNKVQLLFDGKPDLEIREFIKKSGHAFKWSPKNKIWQRQLNTYYRLSMKDLFEFLGIRVNKKKQIKQEIQVKIPFEEKKDTVLACPDKQLTAKIAKPIVPVVQHIPPAEPISIPPVVETPIVPVIQNKEPNIHKHEVRVPAPKKQTNKENTVYSSSDISSMNFDTLTFTGEWAEFIQEPAKNMKLAIWGKPKNGKTAGATKFANYLTNFGSILYNFADQGINKSTKDLWKLSGLDDKNNAFLTDTRDIKELDELCASGKYDFVFIDMINTYIHRTGIKYFDFEDQFLKKYPNISFILIFEVTKTGNFKGDQGWTHLPDALITVDSFVMHNQGRYGVGEYVVWKEGLKKVNPKKYKEFFNDEEYERIEIDQEEDQYTEIVV
ncbi:hypothetical protein [Tenacibaculum maritimum]|uniref:hypothetical protein n=1 Tax=Tenacibaculum maritimum TaxID=107401 RepID=UPI00388F7537